MVFSKKKRTFIICVWQDNPTRKFFLIKFGSLKMSGLFIRKNIILVTNMYDSIIWRPSIKTIYNCIKTIDAFFKVYCISDSFFESKDFFFYVLIYFFTCLSAMIKWVTYSDVNMQHLTLGYCTPIKIALNQE